MPLKYHEALKQKFNTILIFKFLFLFMICEKLILIHFVDNRFFDCVIKSVFEQHDSVDLNTTDAFFKTKNQCRE